MNASMFFRRNSKLILTGIGVAGVIGTAVLSAMATPKAVYKLKEKTGYNPEKQTEQEKPKPVEVVKATWKCYAPAAAAGAVTIAAIVGSHKLSQKELAAMAGTCVLLQKSYGRYKEKVKEVLGEDAVKKVRDAFVIDKKDEIVKPTNPDSVVFYEELYGKCFERTMVEVVEAVSNLNRAYVTCGEVSLGYFYEQLGIDTDDALKALGWNASNTSSPEECWIDVSYELTTLDDGLEVRTVVFSEDPYPDFDLPF